MVWKCPKCNKELKENDATRGNCPYCFQTFDRPEEFQEEKVLVEKTAGNFRITERDSDSILLWLSLTALCLLLVSLFLEIWQPPQKYQPASPQIKTEKIAPKRNEPTKPKEENDSVKSLQAKEKEIAQTILLEYGKKTCQKINESLEQDRLLQQKDEAKLGGLFGNPIGLAHTQLQSVYARYYQAYFLLLGVNENPDGFKVITNDIVVSNADFAKGKLVIQLITPSSLNAENTELFKTVHSEPYQFIVSCTRSGNEWKVKEWTTTGTEWNFRPLPH
ncbi:MAG: hypothetical protein ABII89_07340 [Candidatus Omnitrophota bacterium]